MSPVLLRSIVRKVFHQQRSWSDERHFATDDVPQLRQLIETSHPQKAPHGRHSLGVRLKLAIDIPRVGHRPEFEENKRLAKKAGTLLAEENRRSQSDPGERCRDRSQWQEQHKRRQRQNKFEKPLALLGTSFHWSQYYIL